MSGDFETTYERLAKAERSIREARERREREERNAARAQREKLEKQSPSGGRRNLIDILGAAPDMDVITRLHAIQRLMTDGRNRSHTAYLAKAAQQLDEPFDRLSPASRLGRSRSLPKLPDGSLDLKRIDRMSRSYGDGDGRNTGPNSRFDVGPDSPGMPEKTRYEWSEPFDPPLRVERMESRGGVRGDDASGRHFSVGEPEEIVARWLLEEARRLIEHAKSRRIGLGYPK